MPLVSRWGSKVTTVPAREPKANSPRPITLPSRPIAVDLEPTASSLGALVGAPIPVKDFSIIPQAPAPAPDPTAPVSGPSDLIASDIRYSIKLQGAESKIALGTPDIFNFSDSPFTVSLWVKMTGLKIDPVNSGTNTYNALLFHYTPPGIEVGFEITLSGGFVTGSGTTQPMLRFTLYDNDMWSPEGDYVSIASLAVGDSQVPTPDTWANLVFSYDGMKKASGIKMWLNGQPLNMGPVWESDFYTSLYTSSDRQLYVGGQSLSMYKETDFAVDDIAIFDYELSNIDASELYNNGWSVLPNLSPVAYYSCGDAENGFGTSLTNLVSNNTDYAGALIGDATFVQDGAPNGYTK